MNFGKRFFQTACGLAALSMVSGCFDSYAPADTGDGDGDGGTTTETTVDVTAAKGALIGASCTLSLASNPDTTIGTATTDDEGKVSIPYTIELEDTDALLVVCTGGDYYDEALNTTSAVPDDFEFKAVVPAQYSSFAVTPFTTLAAYQLLQLTAEDRDASAASRANTQVEDALVPGLDLTIRPTPIYNDSPDLGSGDADIYSLYLAALCEIGASLGGGADVWTLLQDLFDDAADGVIDGYASGVAVSSYSSLADLGSLLDDAAEAYAEAHGSDALLAALLEEQDTGGTRNGDISITPSGSGSGSSGSTP